MILTIHQVELVVHLYNIIMIEMIKGEDSNQTGIISIKQSSRVIIISSSLA